MRNYFIWRQEDVTTNSLSMLAQSLYAHETLQHRKWSGLQDLCWRKEQVSRLCRSAFLSPVIVEKLVDGTLPLPRFTAVADKLITLPLWAEQHALLGID